MSERMRCLITGCNPLLPNAESAALHAAATGHRTAAWPKRSAEGRRRAKARNRSGYYDTWNVGAKSAEARGLVRIIGEDVGRGDDEINEWGNR